MRIKHSYIILFIILSYLFDCATAAEKKIIGHSWDLLGVRPADVARNINQWEKVPLDGVSLAVLKKPESGETVSFRTIMNDPRWKRSWFKDEIDVLKQCASRNLKHNFLTSYWAPRKRLAWSDDVEWERFAHNLGVLAWLAKEGRADGILIDPEDYPQTRQYFRAKTDPAFPVVAALARKRGAQVMRTMAEQYPEITLLSFWLLSMHPEYLSSPEPQTAVADAGDLWPSFVNGMLDELPESARLVDGNEHGYRYEAKHNDFYLSVFRMQNKALNLVEPCNRIKYQTQVLGGFGLYLDMYTNPADAPWYFGELNGSRLKHLRRNFEQALDAAQEYVWVYGEKMDWIKWKGVKPKQNLTWEQKLPGFTSTLAFLRDPEKWARQEIQRRQHNDMLTNLVCCSEFEKKISSREKGFHEEWLPPKWWFWQDDKKRKGQFGVEIGKGSGDKISLCAAGVENGCFGTSVATQPGRYYALALEAQGVVHPVYVGWKRKGKWDWSIPRVAVHFTTAEGNGWRKAFAVFKIPDKVDELVLSLTSKQGVGEYTWFDNVALYELKFF